MASEASSVLVAVRVRPFTSKEDTVGCVVSVPDDKTISLLDVPTLIPGTSLTASGGYASTTNFNASMSTTSTAAISTTTAPSLEAMRHAYTFDKIFWSVEPSILPFPPAALLSILEDGDGAGAGGRGPKLSKAQKQLLAAHSGVAKHLPCFARAPAYDDQQEIYSFIGPRLYEAVMAGYNACIFAYGQTGSGKSYSMIGPTESLGSALSLSSASSSHAPSATQRRKSSGDGSMRKDAAAVEQLSQQGIMPRLAADLFRLMREEKEKEEGVTYTVELSFLEIYCEKVRDLLSIAGGNNSSSATASGVSAVASAGYFNPSATSGGSLRIRQHPTRGPYVEGLSHVKVRDAAGVVRHLLSGLRDRATAETNMNEHSSRSHAILQLHVTKVTAESDSTTGAVITRTRTCKVNMVDLAGSERVSQSGVSGDRFEEARNINLSLSTLGRVIQQLSEKQAGNKVVPAYRDSVLTWLLSDSLGGNSKTIMLATVAPSAYCYQQTLNTLRFAGVAKKVINVATVNEDMQFQQIISELRQQIVRLTLQLEGGKASEVHLERIQRLQLERDDLQLEIDRLRARTATTADASVLQALKKRIKELEGENAQLRDDKTKLQEKYLSVTASLREEVAQQRAEVIQLHEQLSKKENEVTEWANKYRAVVVTTTSPAMAPPKTSAPASAETAAALQRLRGEHEKLGKQLQQLQDELQKTKTKLTKVTQDESAAQRASEDAKDAAKSATTQMKDYKFRYEESKRQLDLLHERMQSTTALLETTQCELAAIKSHSASQATKVKAVQDAMEASTSAQSAQTAVQLDQVRTDYLTEKQRNVDLLLRLSQVEQERSSARRQLDDAKRDVQEMELLLVEETETSERYYTRMRHQRIVSDAQFQLMSHLQHALHQARASYILSGQPTRRGSAASAAMGGPGSSGAATPRPVEPEDARSSLPAGAESHHGGNSAAEERGRDARYEAVMTRLGHAHDLQDCFTLESRERLSVELQYTTELTRLLAQKARLGQYTVAQLEEKLNETQDRLALAESAAAARKRQLDQQEETYAEEARSHADARDAVETLEISKAQLERRVAALETVQEELESGRNTLIAKLAAQLEVQSLLQQRCDDAERIATEVQDLLFPSYSSLPSPSSSSTSAGLDGRKGSGEGEGGTGHGGAGSRFAELQVQTMALASKVKEVEGLLAAKDALEREVETSRDEIGALRAQLDEAVAERQHAQRELERATADAEQHESRKQEANGQLLKEIETITSDYDSRIKQQQTMMQTLRHALDEETAMADMCRQSAQRAEAARQSLEEELVALQERYDERCRQGDAVNLNYEAVQAELDLLRSEYHALEAQLTELRHREPELYLMLEKGAGEGSAAWADKVRHEKLTLHKQKLEAQRLNSQLLEHVRDRTVRLRDVQRQLTEVSTGAGSTPPATATAMTRESSFVGGPAADIDAVLDDLEDCSVTSRPPRRGDYRARRRSTSVPPPPLSPVARVDHDGDDASLPSTIRSSPAITPKST